MGATLRSSTPSECSAGCRRRRRRSGSRTSGSRVDDHLRGVDVRLRSRNAIFRSSTFVVGNSLLVTSLLLFLLSSASAKDGDFNGNCPVNWKDGDLDKLPAFDFMGRLGLDPAKGDQLNIAGCKVIKGTRPPFNAIHIDRNANLKIPTADMYQYNMPPEFSMVITYRMLKDMKETWYLMRIVDSRMRTQFAVRLDPIAKKLETQILGASGLRTIGFTTNAADLFDKKWRKVHVDVTGGTATLHIGCKPTTESHPVPEIMPIDTSGNILLMTSRDGRQLEAEMQYSAMHCEATRGVRDTCWEMPKDAPKVKREKLNLFQWFKGFMGMFTGDPVTVKGTKKIAGSTSRASALRVGDRADLVLPTSDSLSRGLPPRGFTLESVFRLNNAASRTESWNLLGVEASDGRPQFGLNLDGSDKSVTVFYLDGGGSLQANTFSSAAVAPLFDGQFHKLQLAMEGDAATLYVDCLPAETQTTPGYGPIDVGGNVLTAKQDGSSKTVRVDIQSLRFYKDAARPTKDTCKDLYGPNPFRDEYDFLPPFSLTPDGVGAVSAASAISGADGRSTAYSVRSGGEMKIGTGKMFLAGLPGEFGLEGIVRMKDDSLSSPYHLLRFSSRGGAAEGGVRFDPRRRSVEYSYAAAADGSLRTLSFDGVDGLFDGEFHKVAFVNRGGKMKLVVDCVEVDEKSVEEAKPVSRDGHIQLGVDDRGERTTSFDVQRLRMSLDPRKASTDDCDSLFGARGGGGATFESRYDFLPPFSLTPRGVGSVAAAEQIVGSDGRSAAYSIRRGGTLRLGTDRMFPGGLPPEFGLSGLFRMKREALGDRWDLVRFQSRNGRPEAGVRFDGGRKILEFFYPGSDGRERAVAFRNAGSLFDDQFHRVSFANRGGRLTMYVDCVEVESHPLEDFGEISADGNIYMGYSENTGRTTAVDVQELAMTLDPESASSHSCDDLYSGQTWPSAGGETDLLLPAGLQRGAVSARGVFEGAGAGRGSSAFYVDDPNAARLGYETREITSSGLPDRFTLSGLYQLDNSQVGEDWHLVRMLGSDGRPQFGLRMNGRDRTVELTLVDQDGRPRTTRFTRSVDGLFDDAWHKIHVGVDGDAVTLYVDCVPVETATLAPRGDVDVGGGVQVAVRDRDDKTIPVKLQHLSLDTDPSRGESSDCADLEFSRRSSSGGGGAAFRGGYNILQRFRISDDCGDVSGCSKISGAGSRSAWEIDRRARLDMSARDVFGGAVPESFTLVSTFKECEEAKSRAHNLIKIDDARGNTQFGLKLDGYRGELKVDFTDSRGRPQSTVFRNGVDSLGDCEFHMMHMVKDGDTLRLFVDCQEVDSMSGIDMAPISTDGRVVVAKRESSNDAVNVVLQTLEMDSDTGRADSDFGACAELQIGAEEETNIGTPIPEGLVLPGLFDGVCPDFFAEEDIASLPSYNILSKIGVDFEKEEPFPGTKQIEGENPKKKAMKITRRAVIRESTEQLFPQGLPYDFSVRSIFRVPEVSQNRKFHLVRLEDSKPTGQFGVELNGGAKSVTLYYLDIEGEIYTIDYSRNEINVESLFDGNWHKMTFDIHSTEEQDLVTLYIDCEEVRTDPMVPKGEIDVNGQILVAKTNEYATVPLDLQFLEFHCNPRLGETDTCVVECPEECPQGEKGDEGIKGEVGLRGLPGPEGQKGAGGATGEKGQKGEDGFGGEKGDSGPPGPPGDAGGVSSVGAKGARGLPGPIGRAGPRGDRGQKGVAGDKGDLGEKGNTGLPGLPGAVTGDGAQGPIGDKGDIGPRGPPGRRGLPGPRGPDGPKGSSGGVGALGPVGPAGDIGPQGKMGDKGSRGPVGEKGDPAVIKDVGEPIPGPAGPPGIPGRDGIPGEAGEKGQKGGSGERGEKGSPGLQGRPGVPGLLGPPGSRGQDGQPGPPGVLGDKGEPGLNGARGLRGFPGSPGEPGAVGTSGDPGKVGPEGARGLKGSSGSSAIKGEKGEQGDRGAPGREGDQGPPGPMGRLGDRGEPGTSGIPGVSGLPGPKGDPGHSGKVGERGDPGPQGERGTRGTPGVRGPPGLPGQDGARGDPGKRGTDGPRGEPGEGGIRGPQGLPGPAGPAGLRGPTGPKGNRGPEGPAGPPGDVGGPMMMGVHGAPGPQGPPGPQGIPGKDGLSGQAGPRGSNGAQGSPGAVGPAGLQGPIGVPGRPGPAGQPGQTGPPGRSFSDGDIRRICQGVLDNKMADFIHELRGPPGTPGQSIQGPIGKPGKAGPPGLPGKDGPRGRRGFMGLPGHKGPQGGPGPRGVPGTKGQKGAQGIGLPGPPGIAGPIGQQGPRGDSVVGADGPPGPVGPRGYPGVRGKMGPTGQVGTCKQCTPIVRTIPERVKGP